MAVEAYGLCPCGSGKKFKWCCQPIHVQIDKAFEQNAEGQHDSALRIMDQVVAQNPDNPEAWGRKAQMLFENGKEEEAETTLQKALEINSQYPFGHLLQGIFRQSEGEFPGALSLFRKAADLYNPESRDTLGQIYFMIGDGELRLNRPIAARAAFQVALRYAPATEGGRDNFDAVFGDKSPLPQAAKQAYAFQSPSRQAGQRDQWDRALSGAASGKLTDALQAFTLLSQEDSPDAAAWYNLGLCRAWLGDNHNALLALDQYMGMETDDERAQAAWTLAEVLRCGHGMEDETDYVEHSLLFQISDPNSFLGLLNDWSRERRLGEVKSDKENGLLTGLVLERLPEMTPALAATQDPGLSAQFLLGGDRLRFWNTNRVALEAIGQEVREKLGPTSPLRDQGKRPAPFHEILSESLVFPIQASSQEDQNRRVTAHMQRYFEEKWIHRPLFSLSQVPPIDAVGHRILQNKLRGVIAFLEQCAKPMGVSYDFNRLRHQLGLLGKPEATSAAKTISDVAIMSVAELAALPIAELSAAELEQTYQAAVKLDARELAGRFAAQLVARPPRPDRPDRYPWYLFLMNEALSEGNTEKALDRLNEGEKADCEENEGRRRNDYESRRGQIMAKRGDAADAQRIFDSLIARAPADLTYRGSAVEAMLGMNQGAWALRHAEEGVVKARERNDRDSEEYFMELARAAKKKI